MRMHSTCFMRRAVVIVQLTFFAQAHAEQLLASQEIDRAQDAQLIENSVGKLVKRVFKAWHRSQVHLDGTALGKPGHLAVPYKTLSRSVIPMVRASGAEVPSGSKRLGQVRASDLHGERRQMTTASMPEKLHIDTPLIRSDPLSALTNMYVYLKLDCLQPSGSFKIRGIGRTILQAVKEMDCNHVVSSSGGNAGLAAAYAGRECGVKVTVVVPSTTPPFMRRLLESYGADVQVHGDVWDVAHERAQELVNRDKSGKSLLVHPFVGEQLVEGHSSIVDEVKKQWPPEDLVLKCKLEEKDVPEAPDFFITCVGGGGLVNGIMSGLAKQGGAWDKTIVVPCETDGASSMAQSLRRGELVTLPGITSKAKSLGACRVCDLAFSKAKARKDKGTLIEYTMSDDDVLAACQRFLHDHHIAVELSTGAALAFLYNGKLKEHAGKTVVVEVCGGSVLGWLSEEGVPPAPAN